MRHYEMLARECGRNCKAARPRHWQCRCANHGPVQRMQNPASTRATDLPIESPLEASSKLAPFSGRPVQALSLHAQQGAQKERTHRGPPGSALGARAMQAGQRAPTACHAARSERCAWLLPGQLLSSCLRSLSRGTPVRASAGA